MTFTVQQIADFKGVSRRTMHRYLSMLVDNGVFKKKSIGIFYSESEIIQLECLLDFSAEGVDLSRESPL